MLRQQNVTQETSQEDANSFLQSNSILGMESAKLPEKFKNEQKESMKSKLLHSQDEAWFPSHCPIHFFFFLCYHSEKSTPDSSWHLFEICETTGTRSSVFSSTSLPYHYPLCRTMMEGWPHSCPAPSLPLCRLVWGQGRSIPWTWWPSGTKGEVSPSPPHSRHVCINGICKEIKHYVYGVKNNQSFKFINGNVFTCVPNYSQAQRSSVIKIPKSAQQCILYKPFPTALDNHAVINNCARVQEQEEGVRCCSAFGLCRPPVCGFIQWE